MKEENLKEALESVRIIDEERNYWFVRTFGGEIFNAFINNDLIGLGFNNVPQDLILAASSYEKQEAHKVLRDFIENNTDAKKGTATNQKNQLIRFQHEMKIGDLVIIPNRNSHVLSIGEITSNVRFLETDKVFFFKDSYHSFPNRIRRVNWLAHRSRSFFKGGLRNLFSSQQGITDANKYADKIESGISSMYIRGDVMRLVINIKQDEDINAFVLNRFLSSLTYFYNEFCDELGIERNEDLHIKIKLQSEGYALFASIGIVALTAVACIIAMSKDAKFKGKITKEEGFEFGFSSGDGFLKSLSDFLDRKAERKRKFKELGKSTERLEIENPYDDGESVNVKKLKPGTNEEQDS